MVSAPDFAVTANAVAGLAPDPGFDGVDLLPFLVGESPEIARELEAQLEAWVAELQPPGFPAPFPRDFKIANFLREPPPRSAPLSDLPPGCQLYLTESA